MDGVIVIFLVILLLVPSSNAMAFEREDEYVINSSKAIGCIGGITDCSTRVGREEKIAMEIAVDDFYNLTGHKLALELRDLSGNSAQAILTAIDLIKSHQLHAIIGTSTWQEAALVNEMDNSGEVPIVSLATPVVLRPVARPVKAPSVIHMGHDIYVQLRCIAAIIDYFQWRKVTVIYEDKSSYRHDLSIITLLSHVLRQIGTQLEHYSAFPVLSSLLDPKAIIQQELKKLIDKESRVFIVIQASLPFAVLLFEQAKQMGIMDKGHVWIAADGITSLLDSLNSSLINSMEGVLGLKAHFSDSTASYKRFKARFRRKFLSEYPDEEENPDPSSFALRAYDAILAIAEAIERAPEKQISRSLLSKMLPSNFKGLSGRTHFSNHMLMQIPTFRIVNVIGKSYREMGFWSPKFGFSKTPVAVKHDIVEQEEKSSATQVLDAVYWPGRTTFVSNALADSSLSRTTDKPLRILVPSKSKYPEFVQARHDKYLNRTFLMGFSVDVFVTVSSYMPYSLQYTFIPFEGPFDEMLQMVYLKDVDAAIGDIEITTDRYGLVEFTQPYIDSGLVLVVPAKANTSQEGWMFMAPFTTGMWFLMIAMSLLTGFVVWLIEHQSNSDFRGSTIQHFGQIFWFLFTTLYLGQRDSLRSNLSRLVMIPWLFLILIVGASFTANLTSMMTTSRLVPSPVDVGYLRRTNATVGCDGSRLILVYLVDVLNFKAEQIKILSSYLDFAEALTNGSIEAAFLLSPYANFFLARYCRGFSLSGPTYKLGGFGFAFQRGSPLASDFSKVILRLSENGALKELEEKYISRLKCSASQVGDTGDQSLGPLPFSGLFALSGGVTGIALLVTLAGSVKKLWQLVMTNFPAKLVNMRRNWRELLSLLLAKKGNGSAPVANLQLVGV